MPFEGKADLFCIKEYEIENAQRSCDCKEYALLVTFVQHKRDATKRTVTLGEQNRFAERGE